MIAQVFFLLVALQVCQSIPPPRPRATIYKPEDYAVNSRELFDEVFHKAEDVSVTAIREALIQLQKNQRPDLIRKTAVDDLVEISAPMSSPCDRGILKLMKRLVWEYRGCNENLRSYLLHYYEIINNQCLKHLNEQVLDLVSLLDHNKKPFILQLQEIYLSNKGLYSEKGELATKWILDNMDLMKINEPSDIRTQAEELFARLDENCASLVRLFRQSGFLQSLRNEIGELQVNEYSPQLKNTLDWPKICKKADPKHLLEHVLQQVHHRLYEIDSLAWIHAGAGGSQPIVDEWRLLKQSLYAPEAQPLSRFQVVFNLDRLIWIINSDYSMGFRKFANDWDLELKLLTKFSEDRCTSEALGIFDLLERKHSRSPVILNYIRFVNHALLNFCMTKFHNLLSEALGPIQTNEAIRSSFDNVLFHFQADRTSQVAFSGPALVQAINNYLLGFTEAEVKEQRLKELRDACVELRSRLPPLLVVFNHMNKYAEHRLNRDDAAWMYGLKICLGMETLEHLKDQPDVRDKKMKRVVEG